MSVGACCTASCGLTGSTFKLSPMRKASVLALVLLVALGVFLANGPNGANSAGGSNTAGGEEEEVEGAGACGVERWRVKTLTDKDAGKVNFTPRTATVNGLRARKPPSHLTDRRGR